MRKVQTYRADIYAGLLEGSCGQRHYIEEVNSIIKNYVKENSLRVTITPTKFYHDEVEEEGVIIGLINYPHYPMKSQMLQGHALELARILKRELKQRRVTLVCNDETITLGK